MSNNTILEIDDNEPGIIGITNQKGTPERRLLLAVLERSILDFVGNDRKEADAAAEWLFTETDENANDDNCEEFSFAWVCNFLDLDKSSVLRQVKAMPKRGKNKIAPWYFAKAA
jgi:hypothetical protein